MRILSGLTKVERDEIYKEYKNNNCFILRYDIFKKELNILLLDKEKNYLFYKIREFIYENKRVSYKTSELNKGKYAKINYTVNKTLGNTSYLTFTCDSLEELFLVFKEYDI